MLKRAIVFNIYGLLFACSLGYSTSSRAETCDKIYQKCQDQIQEVAKFQTGYTAGSFATFGISAIIGAMDATRLKNSVCKIFGHTEIPEEYLAPRYCQKLWDDDATGEKICQESTEEMSKIKKCSGTPYWMR